MRTWMIAVTAALGMLLAQPTHAEGPAARGQSSSWEFGKASAPKVAGTPETAAHVVGTSKDAEVANKKANGAAATEARPSTTWDFSAARAVDVRTVGAAPARTAQAPNPEPRSAPLAHATASYRHASTAAGVHLVWRSRAETAKGRVPDLLREPVLLRWDVRDRAPISSHAAARAEDEGERVVTKPIGADVEAPAAPAAEEGGRERLPPLPGAGERGESSEAWLVPGRPGFTESRGVVPARALQLEGGYSFTADNTDGLVSHTSSMPGAVVRIGLDGRTELRIAGAGLTRQTQTSALEQSRSVGFSDVQVGVKVMALRERDSGVEVAVVPMISIPSHANAVSSFGYDPSLTVSFARALPREFDATGLVRWASLTVGGGRATQYSGSVSVGHEIWNGWGGSAEVFTLSDPITGALQWNLGAAVARPVGRRLQVDFDLGHSLNYLAPTWTFGAGFVVR